MIFIKISNTKKLIISNLAVYGFVHGLVDATCAAVIFSNISNENIEIQYFVFLTVLYNIIAFGTQPLVGIIVDKYRAPVLSAILGCVFVATATVIAKEPLISIILAGIGNALYHIGGGVISINLKPGKASAVGIYVAPGALGLMLGTLIGKQGYFIAWPFILLLCISILLIILVKAPDLECITDNKIKYNKFELIISLIFASVVIRSLIGLILNFPWKSNIYLLVTITLAVVLGKALGGILADKFGWINITIVGLLISSPLLLLGSSYPYLAIIGVFIFNMTMPVTLTVLANMFPGKAGFAFGLTTLAILIGAFPTFTTVKTIFMNNWFIFVTIIFMTFILYKGLRLYFKDTMDCYNKNIKIQL